jgi:hypothetical protein
MKCSRGVAERDMRHARHDIGYTSLELTQAPIFNDDPQPFEKERLYQLRRSGSDEVFRSLKIVW